jgi:hypothetical protein
MNGWVRARGFEFWEVYFSGEKMRETDRGREEEGGVRFPGGCLSLTSTLQLSKISKSRQSLLRYGWWVGGYE